MIKLSKVTLIKVKLVASLFRKYLNNIFPTIINAHPYRNNASQTYSKPIYRSSRPEVFLRKGVLKIWPNSGKTSQNLPKGSAQ